MVPGQRRRLCVWAGWRSLGALTRWLLPTLPQWLLTVSLQHNQPCPSPALLLQWARALRTSSETPLSKNVLRKILQKSPSLLLRTRRDGRHTIPHASITNSLPLCFTSALIYLAQQLLMFHSPVGQHILLLAYMVKIKSDYQKLLGFNSNIGVSYKCSCDCREGRWSGRDEEPH